MLHSGRTWCCCFWFAGLLVAWLIAAPFCRCVDVVARIMFYNKCCAFRKTPRHDTRVEKNAVWPRSSSCSGLLSALNTRNGLNTPPGESKHKTDTPSGGVRWLSDCLYRKSIKNRTNNSKQFKTKIKRHRQNVRPEGATSIISIVQHASYQ